MKPSHARPGLLLLAGVLALGVTAAAAQEKKETQQDRRDPPPLTLVRVDISEKTDGRDTTAHTVQYRTIRLLWFAGLEFKSERKTRWDKKLETYKPRKKGEPDFFVKGETSADLLRRPTWYGKPVAYIYGGKAEITIEDAEGELVAHYRLSLERSDTKREEAITKTLRILGHFTASAIIECRQIQERIPEARKQKLEEVLTTIKKELEEHEGTLEDLTPERPEEEKEEEPEQGARSLQPCSR